MQGSFTLREVPAVERPRERMVEHGIASLSTTEILALILGRGTAGQPVMQISHQLLSGFGSLKGIAEASLQDLQQIKGVGLAKAAQLQACAEIARRMQQAEVQDKTKLVNPETVWQLARSKVSHYHKEHYILLTLDVRQRLLGVDILSIGNLDAALVHPRETFEMAIRRHAAKVIVCHNHPSGDPTPSEDDVMVTKRLITAGKILGIAVIDHVIITHEQYYSLQEHGQI